MTSTRGLYSKVQRVYVIIPIGESEEDNVPAGLIIIICDARKAVWMSCVIAITCV